LWLVYDVGTRKSFEENIFFASERKKLKIEENDMTKSFMNCAPHKYYYSNKVQGCMMGGARDRDG
jgi:hypothetical protein